MDVFNHESLKLQFKLDNEFELVFVVRPMDEQIYRWTYSMYEWTNKKTNGQTVINTIIVIIIIIVRLCINAFFSCRMLISYLNKSSWLFEIVTRMISQRDHLLQ